MTRSRKSIDGPTAVITIVVLLVLLIAVYFIGLAVTALIFKWVWNGFVVSHLSGATATSWSSALLPAILIQSIAATTAASGRRSE
jgi:hypothetical protein